MERRNNVAIIFVAGYQIFTPQKSRLRETAL